MWKNSCFNVENQRRRVVAPELDPRHGMFAAETLLAYSTEQERTGGDLDAAMQLGSAGGRGARGGARRI